MVTRFREFVSLPFLILGAKTKKSGSDGMAYWMPGSYAYEVNAARAAIGEVWWQIGIALLGNEPHDDKLMW